MLNSTDIDFALADPLRLASLLRRPPSALLLRPFRLRHRATRLRVQPTRESRPVFPPSDADADLSLSAVPRPTSPKYRSDRNSSQHAVKPHADFFFLQPYLAGLLAHESKVLVRLLRSRVSLLTSSLTTYSPLLSTCIQSDQSCVLVRSASSGRKRHSVF